VDVTQLLVARPPAGSPRSEVHRPCSWQRPRSPRRLGTASCPYAYPQTEVRYPGVLACYATGVALSSVTPAHAGRLVTVLMFVAIIPAATVTGVVAAAAVEKLEVERWRRG